MTRRYQYAAGACVITPLWLVASFILAMELVGSEDPGLPIGEIVTHVDGQEIVSVDPNYKGDHQGEFPTVPLWLKAANVAAMPVAYILPANGFRGLSDHVNGFMFILAMFLSSLLWGLLIVFVFRLVSRRFRVRQDLDLCKTRNIPRI
jgi:hypothetical protein